MDWKRRVTVVMLAIVLVSVAMIVQLPTARAQVGPKTITVDGDPSDWTGVVPAANTGAESNGEFVWNDAAGDDTGDGDYTYPTAPDLNVTGLFDLTEVRITADPNNLYVLIRVGDLNNPWGGEDGFSTVTGALLIDTTLDTSGQTAATPNVNVLAGSGWEYWVRLGNPGWHVTSKKVYDASGRWAPVQNEGDPALDAIEVSIPLTFIGKDGYDIDGATWRFFFFLQSHDGARSNGFREVVAAKYTGAGDPADGASYVFGGGADHAFDPEIMDMAFAATQLAQETELGGYTPTTAATISSWADVTFSNTIGFTPDAAAPVISSVSATPTFNTAQISWTTDEVANGTVLWGTTSGALTQQAPQPSFGTSHSVTITGLQPLDTYYYQVVAWDIAGNRQETSEASFTTTAAPPSNLASWVGTTFVWEDQMGDDVGDGNYVYPLEASIDWAGRSDLSWVNMTRSATALHFNVKVNAGPETIWHQRMATVAIFIDQDHQYDSGGRSVGLVGNEADEQPANQHPMNLSVAPNFAFEYLVVANFQNGTEAGRVDPAGEMLVFNNTWNANEQRWSLIYISTAPSISPEPDTGQIFATDGNVVDIWLNHSVFGTSDNWTFVIAAMIFDDAARPFEQGGIRAVKGSTENWAGGGANGPFNPNVYDLAFYPDTASQTTDLSNYTTGRHANITRGVQVNFGTQYHRLVRAAPITHTYAVAATRSPTSLDEDDTATITATFTDKGAGIQGASVSISFAPSSAGSLVGSTIQTTDAIGRATFTFRAGQVSSDTTVTFTISAANGTAPSVTTTTTVTVNAPTTTVPPSAGLDPLVLGAGIGAAVLIAIVAVALLLMRKRKGPGGTQGGTEGNPPT